MLHLRGDAIWSERRAQSIREDNDTGSVIYQRKVESEASDIPGRHSPHALRQGCIEIDLTGDSPVPEESGLDSVGGKTEVGTRKEWGVSGMVVELREDGRNAPREEGSAAPGGCSNLDWICKEKEETKNQGLSSTPREVEFCEVATPTSKLVDDVHAICDEPGNSLRVLEWNGNNQPNDVGRINILEENTSREQTEVAGMGCSVNNTNKEQGREDIRPRKLDPPGEHTCNQREGVQSSVKDTGEKGRVAAATEDRSYLSEDMQHVYEVDDSQEKGSTIAHPNTESIREENEQPGHHNTNGTHPWRTEDGSRRTKPDGEKAGRCTEGEEGHRDIANSRTENTRFNFRTDCAGALLKYLETILHEKEERERKTQGKEVVLVHSFLRNIGRTLIEKMNEARRNLKILILPAWLGQTWILLLQPGHSIKTLGTFQDCMIPGAKMRREGWKQPPGEVISVTLEKRIYKEGTSSSNVENTLEKEI
ncbi:uncharacterized protein MONOS_10849 [Monocercomonoides exilis]|uniref:uncharacterized protein n=1 Tax=Monocercomonoides exilis TaxID=2049356 RepID=UPI00355A2505|nr:hypothetical protein MONOS_10849 [Monocercomonoides exilis]|eukprot:MONOS_10849.1-p1 / transcript=MONOS_10849.1 / gene=MONOS_10849 / organism=Monocercomonoides_exilis_PA203 / gene_product=unspecified product / transcript_product=unspecified product / location=Mono_scaffold00511:3384-4868(+) / protein_length=479 / sequence_SO=supercontig / SO=protein_coding / is_pseudo=false